MTPLPRPSAVRLLSAVVLGVLLLAGVPTAGAVTSDPSVRDAQDALDEARERMAQTQSQLDGLASQFESARDHTHQLEEELDDADDRVATAQAAVASSRAAEAEAVRRAYMLPGVETLRVSGAFLLAPDVETALHAAALMGRVASGRADAAAAADRANDNVSSDISSQRGIAAGTEAALQDLQRLAGVFGTALQAAAADVTVAEEALALAVDDAEARAWQQQFQGSITTVAAPLVRIATVNGQQQEMTCPLGQPNGFVDTWHAPRSGGRLHKGVDMFAAYGMPIFAAADGVITRVWNSTLGGLSIDLIDRYGNRYYHAHLSAAYVVPGQVVRVGTLIAANGQSGNARFTPPHLHWQFHPGGGVPVNPTRLAAALCR